MKNYSTSRALEQRHRQIYASEVHKSSNSARGLRVSSKFLLFAMVIYTKNRRM